MAFHQPDDLDIEHVAAIDKMFVDPLHIGDVKLPGVVQAVDFHMLRHRVQRGFEHPRFALGQHFLHALVTVCMLTAPLSDSGTVWFEIADVLIILCLVAACAEMAVYTFAYGIRGESSNDTASADNQRAMAVLAVWSPPRLRQSAEASNIARKNRRGQERLPLLAAPGRIVECLLLVTSAIGYLIPWSSPFSRLRFVHGLRGVKLLKGFAVINLTIAHLLETLVHSLPMLVTAATFFAFFFVVFGVLGVDPFKGGMSFRCHAIDLVAHPDANITGIPLGDLCTPGSPYSCIESVPEMICSPDAEASFWSPYPCQAPLVCRERRAPNLGYTSFDNIGNAWLAMLQITSLSNWTDLLYAMWADAPRIVAGAYCFLLIVIVSFILLNLVTAVVSSSYSKTWTNHVRKRRSSGRRSFIAVELERLTHWNFPVSVVHHLSLDAGSTRKHGQRNAMDARRSSGTDRAPFYKSVRYAIVSDLVLAFVVCMNAANDTKRDAGFRDVVFTIEIVYTVCFAIEFLLSVIASGSIHKYATSRLRMFDALCLGLAFFGLIVRINLCVIRSIRFVRWVGVFPFVRGILARVQKILLPTLGIAIVLGLYVVVFAATSVKLFSRYETHLRTESITTRTSRTTIDADITFFNDEVSALSTLFRFVTVDGWQLPMYVTMDQFYWLIGVCFFVPVYLIFGLVLTSLFIAVIIDAFDPSKEEKLAVQRRQAELDSRQAVRTPKMMVGSVLDSFDFDADADIGDLAESQLTLADRSANAGEKDSADLAAAELDKAVEHDGEVQVQQFRNAVADASFGCIGVGNKARQALIRLVVDIDEREVRAHTRRVEWRKRHVKGYGLTEAGDKAGEMRHKASELEAPHTFGGYFAWGIMLFVAASCVQVFLDPPNEACSAREPQETDVVKRLFLALDIIFVFIFAAEAILKMVAIGAVFPGDDRPWYLGPTYFQDGWNVLDFFLLVVMIVAFFVPAAKPLRILRTLRPLRVIRRVRHMRHMITGLLSSMPSIIVVFGLAMYIIFVGAIVGVNIFAGKMHYCTQNTVGGQPVITSSDCRGVSFNSDGVPSPNSWRRPQAHFDHVGGGIMFITEIASLSEWTLRMQQVVDVVDVDKQPQANNNTFYSVFFVVLVVSLSLVATQIIVGVLMYHFDAHRGVLLLTDQQKDWVNLRSEIKALKPIPPPPRTIFAKLQPLVMHPGFETLVNVAVFLNIVLLATTHNKQTDTWTAIQFWGNVFFLAFFFIECLLKVMALSVEYFKVSWNLLDFAVLVGSIIEFAIELASGNQGSAIVSVARTFRILRVFRSVKRIPNLRNVFHTLALSFFSIASVTVFIVIVLFIFGAIGRNIFGNVRQLEFLNRNANFRSLDIVFFLMFRLLTLDRWATVMGDLMSYYPPFCSQNQPGWYYVDPDTGNTEECGMLNDCSSEASQVFFIAFYAVSGYLVVSVMVAMLLENFKFISTQTRVAVKMRDFDGFQRGWLRARRPMHIQFNYDDYIDPRLLSAFIIDLFNHRNTLVVNPEGLVIHPVVSARSRLNFRKLKFELDALGRHQKRPAERWYTFHAVLLVLTRMQLGNDVLTARQREDRTYFDMVATIAIGGERIRRYFEPMLVSARQRIAARRAERLFADVATAEVQGGSDSDEADASDFGSPGPLRRAGALKRPGSKVGFDMRGTPADSSAISTPQPQSPVSVGLVRPVRRNRGHSEVIATIPGAPRPVGPLVMTARAVGDERGVIASPTLVLTRPDSMTKRSPDGEPLRNQAEGHEASSNSDDDDGLIQQNPPLAGRVEQPSSGTGDSADNKDTNVQAGQPTPFVAESLDRNSASSQQSQLRSSVNSPSNPMSRNVSVSQNELRAAFQRRHGGQVPEAHPTARTAAPIAPAPVPATKATTTAPGVRTSAFEGVALAASERDDRESPEYASEPSRRNVGEALIVGEPAMCQPRRTGAAMSRDADDAASPPGIERRHTLPPEDAKELVSGAAGSDPPASADARRTNADIEAWQSEAQLAAALESVVVQESRRRARKQLAFVTKVWGATRRFIEGIEDGVRAQIRNGWRDALWAHHLRPQRRLEGMSPARNHHVAEPFGTGHGQRTPSPIQRVPDVSGTMTATPVYQAGRHASALPYGSGASPARDIATPMWHGSRSEQQGRAFGRRGDAGSHRIASRPVAGVPLNPILAASASRLPLCYDDGECPMMNDPQHQRNFRHTCRFGDDCPWVNDVAHRRAFLHPAHWADGSGLHGVISLDGE